MKEIEKSVRCTRFLLGRARNPAHCEDCGTQLESGRHSSNGFEILLSYLAPVSTEQGLKDTCASQGILVLRFIVLFLNHYTRGQGRKQTYEMTDIAV